MARVHLLLGAKLPYAELVTTVRVDLMGRKVLCNRFCCQVDTGVNLNLTFFSKLLNL